MAAYKLKFRYLYIEQTGAVLTFPLCSEYTQF